MANEMKQRVRRDGGAPSARARLLRLILALLLSLVASAVAAPALAVDCTGVPNNPVTFCDDMIFCNGVDFCFDEECFSPGIPDDPPTTCSDGVFCNGVEICVNTVCTSPGDPCSGPDGDNDCKESCGEAGGGNCEQNDMEGSACDDGNECTSNTCSAGKCGSTCLSGQPAAMCTVSPTCGEGLCRAEGGVCFCAKKKNECEGSHNTCPCTPDGNVCTDDICAFSKCIHPATPTTQDCKPCLKCDGATNCTICTPDADCKAGANDGVCRELKFDDEDRADFCYCSCKR